MQVLFFPHRTVRLVVFSGVAWLGIGAVLAGAAAASQTGQTASSESADSESADSESADSESVLAEPGRQPAAVPQPDILWPLVCLAVGVAVVLGLIVGWKLNAFLPLIMAAMLVSLMAPGAWGEKISRVAVAFGSNAGNIGIVIALAAVIGKCMLDSGAADRIVRAFLRVLGEDRAPLALMSSGFVLAVPVFFDTVFYLLVPLARSLYRRTNRRYLLYVLAIGGGGAITHTLVPPTPGPLVMAATLKFDVGLMILVGGLVALPTAIIGLVFSDFLDRRMPIPMRPLGDTPEPPPLPDSQLPALWLSVLPVVLPVLLISTNTVVETAAKNAIQREWERRGVVVASTAVKDELDGWLHQPERIEDPAARRLAEISGVTNVFGNANFALLISTLIALATMVRQRNMSRFELAKAVEVALMSGGVIILITASGGAFGAMLKEARVGEAIRALFTTVNASGVMLLLLGFGVAGVLKVAQGSSTVAMITGSAMLAGIANVETLGFHPVYLATAIGSGSLFGSWMNDSGFWIFAKMSGLTEVEALKSWTILLVVLAFTGLLVTMLLATVLPDPLFFAGG